MLDILNLVVVVVPIPSEHRYEHSSHLLRSRLANVTVTSCPSRLSKNSSALQYTPLIASIAVHKGVSSKVVDTRIQMATLTAMSSLMQRHLACRPKLRFVMPDDVIVHFVPPILMPSLSAGLPLECAPEILTPFTSRARSRLHRISIT